MGGLGKGEVRTSEGLYMVRAGNQWSVFLQWPPHRSRKAGSWHQLWLPKEKSSGLWKQTWGILRVLKSNEGSCFFYEVPLSTYSPNGVMY